MDKDETRPVDYKTHILIGQTPAGKMMVISNWWYVPRQAEVQQKIEGLKEAYSTYFLCTPTSIMLTDCNDAGQRPGPTRRLW
jgi:hypothetical protein